MITRVLSFFMLTMIAFAATCLANDSVALDGTISGHVYDADTKQPLSQAFVYCQEVKCSKSTTNSEGYFATDPCFSSSNTYTIQCTRHGYETATKSVTTDQDGKAVADFNLVAQGSRPIGNQPPIQLINFTKEAEFKCMPDETSKATLNVPYALDNTSTNMVIVEGLRIGFELGQAYQKAIEGVDIADFNLKVDKYNAWVRTNFGEDPSLLMQRMSTPG